MKRVILFVVAIPRECGADLIECVDRRFGIGQLLSRPRCSSRSDVTEGCELRRFFAVDARRLRRRLHERLDGLSQTDVRATILFESVAFFRRIFGEIVKLGLRRADEMIVAFDQRMQIAPSEMKTRIVRLGVDLSLRAAIESDEKRLPRAPPILRQRSRRAIEDRWKNIDKLHGRVDARSRFGLLRQFDQQRLMARRVPGRRDERHAGVTEHVVVALQLVHRGCSTLKRPGEGRRPVIFRLLHQHR